MAMAEVRNEHARHAGNHGEGLIHSRGGLLASAGPFRPMVDFVARINTGVFMKLLSGFLVGALLLLGMGILSIIQQVVSMRRPLKNKPKKRTWISGRR